MRRLPFDPHPSTLWTLHRVGKSASCEVAFVPIGREVRIFRNAALLLSRIFAACEEALPWASNFGGEGEVGRGRYSE